MENFVVSARKYRPATFDTVVGQQSITHTLKNAIKNKCFKEKILYFAQIDQSLNYGKNIY